jgi:Spy/CpxP family protein refolding chaperone
MLRKCLIAAALSAALAFVASAQRGGGGGFGGGGFQDKSETIAKELKLSKEQKAEVDAILDEAQKQTTPLVAKIREGRANFIDSTMGDKPVEPALKNITELYAQAVGIEVDAIAKVMAKLDGKQKEKAAKVFDMSGMFLSGSWRRSR